MYASVRAAKPPASSTGHIALSHRFSSERDPAGARFSKVPIINGPGKLSLFTLKIEVSIVLHLT